MEFIRAIVAFILCIYLLLKIFKNPKTNNLPPGPMQLPIIGNLHLLFGKRTHHALRDLAMKYGPIMHLKVGQVSTIIVTSPEIAREFLKTHDLVFSNRPQILSIGIVSYNFAGIVFAAYGEHWRQIRKICTVELLSVRRVQAFRSIREDETDNLVELISSEEGSVINFSRMISRLTYSVTARAAFGNRCKSQEEFISLVEEILELFDGLNIVDIYPSIKLLHTISGMRAKFEQTHAKFDAILEHIVDEHRDKRRSHEKSSVSEEKGDLVDILLNIQETGEIGISLTNNNIKAVILDIFTAGSETSSVTTEWAMSELLRNPKAMAKVQEEVRRVFGSKGRIEESGIVELKYLQAVIKETLRLHPVVPLLLARESIEKCRIFGYDLPAKTRVNFNVWAIARNPKYWPEPENFKPERFLGSAVDFKGNDFSFIPFGSGRRICPGINFSMANIELPLAKLLFHFDWELPGGLRLEELDMTENSGITVRRENNLLLVPVKFQCFV